MKLSESVASKNVLGITHNIYVLNLKKPDTSLEPRGQRLFF